MFYQCLAMLKYHKKLYLKLWIKIWIDLHHMKWYIIPNNLTNVFQKIIFLYQSASQNFILFPGSPRPSMFFGGLSNPDIQYECNIGLS